MAPMGGNATNGSLYIIPFFFSICFITRDDEIPRLKENYSLYILKLIETFNERIIKLKNTIK
jgi:hypothetical protein